MNSKMEQPAWIEEWARRIEAMGLSSVALLLVEIARPFGLVGGQMLLMTQPLLTGIVDDATIERTVALLDGPELLDRLSVRLEGEGS